mmetsp:Transcript_9502/g.16385  ORF Transcript_9502/g.16385 Transcript_9502/m.16385 type:complete len:392 (-) Transcript_9502:468-1643(-)|eukprot:CAMPEP_0196651860 /NCGR_PEP_ID=MMETSP1086-20130531/1003_1 /TAXON_ID=77921 /ORGANISM="Cyanoptyche  gloeocystis , Strain SAG4.97" /LENGTH=391 /DNA_ID=CAMNT_0041982117 /DNA_START=235 /DNA_END=1410 /DNA_ORIENTATION=+
MATELVRSTSLTQLTICLDHEPKLRRCTLSVLQITVTVHEPVVWFKDCVSSRRPSRPCKNEDTVQEERLSVLFPLSVPPTLSLAVSAANEALLAGKMPEMSFEGVSGAYFLRDTGNQIVGVLKPNCSGRVEDRVDKSTTWRKGVPAEAGYLRECCAFMLDHGGFAGVPPTGIVEMVHPGGSDGFGRPTRIKGSFQLFIDSTCSTEDMGPAKFPTRGVHHIGMLDLRLLNADRHSGNILWKEDTKQLIPIDHALSLPEFPEIGDIWFCWMSWSQAKIPFDAESLRYIEELNADQDAAILRSLQLPESAVTTMKIGTLLLKKGASMGLTLYELGTIAACPAADDSVSDLQRVSINAIDATNSAESPEFWTDIEQEIDALIMQRLKNRTAKNIL